jgi:hypothetical protein
MTFALIRKVPAAQDPGQLLGSSQPWTPERRKPAKNYGAFRPVSSGRSPRHTRNVWRASSARKRLDSHFATSLVRSACTGREWGKSSAGSSCCRRKYSTVLLPWASPNHISGSRRRINANREPDHKEAVLLMADRNPTDCGEFVLTDYAAEEMQAQRVVLAFLLDEHPSRLKIFELCRALYAHPIDFNSNDAVERAIRELDSAGLVHCDGGCVVPSRAALYFARLEMD